MSEIDWYYDNSIEPTEKEEQEDELTDPYNNIAYESNNDVWNASEDDGDSGALVPIIIVALFVVIGLICCCVYDYQKK